MTDREEIRFRRSWAVWLATGFGFGFCPIAPGTVGGLWGIPLAWGIAHIPSWGVPAIVFQLMAIVAVCGVGIPICTAGAKELGVKDPGMVVWDEIASMPITYLFVSVADLNCPLVLAVGFALNRFFDILKPPPARQLEALPDGLGIMSDDWLAGVYSCLVLHALMFLEWI